MDDGVGESPDDFSVRCTNRDFFSLVVRPLAFDRIERFSAARDGGLTADEIGGDFVKRAPNLAAWLVDNIGGGAVAAFAEHVEGQLIVVYRFGDAGKLGVSLEPVLAVNLGIEAIRPVLKDQSD